MKNDEGEKRTFPAVICVAYFSVFGGEAEMCDEGCS